MLAYTGVKNQNSKLMADVLNFNQLAQALACMVQAWPRNNDIEQERINCFAVLQGLDDFQSPNLNKAPDEIRRDYFFSRKWQGSGYNPAQFEIDLPALCMVPGSYQQDDNFTAGNYTFQLVLAYPQHAGQSLEERKNSMLRLFHQFILEFRELVCVQLSNVDTQVTAGEFDSSFSSAFAIDTTTTTPSEVTGLFWFSETYLQQLIDDGVVTEQQIERKATINAHFPVQQPFAQYVEKLTDHFQHLLQWNLVITLEFDCEPLNFNYSKEEVQQYIN